MLAATGYYPKPCRYDQGRTHPGLPRHILTAIERIKRYTENMGEAEFMANELVQDAVIRNIEIIGEAANNIQRAALPFTTLHKHIPWSVMYAMRNRVCHG